MFNWLIQQAKNLFNTVTGQNKPAPKPAPKPATPAKKAQPAQNVWQPVQNVFNTVAKTVNTWVNPNVAKVNNGQAQAEAKRRADEQARIARQQAEARARVQGAFNLAKTTAGSWLLPQAKNAQNNWKQKGTGNVFILPKYKNFAPIAPLAPVPLPPPPMWVEGSGNSRSVVNDIKQYESSVDRYNTQWKEYVGARFTYSNDLFNFNQKNADTAQRQATTAETIKLQKAQFNDKKANVWGKIGNFFTGGQTQATRDTIKNTIESENKKMVEKATQVQKSMEVENKKWLGVLQTKLEAGDVTGFNAEFDKYDKYMTQTQTSLTESQYKVFGKQQAQQSFLNSHKDTGLITGAKNLGTDALGGLLNLLDVPRRGLNTAWNMIDKTRTRTYYDGSVKTDKTNNWKQAWDESLNQNVISQHQTEAYDAKKAQAKFRNDYVNYSNSKSTGAWSNTGNFIRKDMNIPAGLSEQQFYKKRWSVDQAQQGAWSGVRDFWADPLFGIGKLKTPLKAGAEKLIGTSLWKKSGGLVVKNATKAVRTVTSNPKIASAIIGARVGKVGQAVDWLKKPSTATAQGRWEHTPAVQRAMQGRELAQAELDTILSKKWSTTFNKQLQLLPTKIKDSSGNMVRVEGVDILKTKLAKMTPVQSRAFNHYVQAKFDKTGKKLISKSYSWTGSESYLKKLSRKDLAVVHNLATAYKAVTDKLYSIDRATAKRGFSKVNPNLRTFTGGAYPGAKQQFERALPGYTKKQGYIAKAFKNKSWADRLEKMKVKMFRVGDKVTRAKPVNKWDAVPRRDPHFTQHKKVAFSKQSGKEIASSLDTRITATRTAWGKTVPENYTAKTQGKRLQGYNQNPNQRWVGKAGKLDNKFNAEIKLRSGIKGYEADLADMATRREFQKGTWEKVMQVAGFPKKVWSQSVTRFRPAWYLNNMAWNVPASAFASGGKNIGGAYKQVIKASIKEKTLVPQLLRELPKEVTNMSAKYGTLGTKIENMSRASAYLAMRQSGMPKAEAIKRLNDWLFDYSKTANWERPLHTVMPFWSFHKGLAMIAIKAPLKYPGASFLIASFKREFMDKPLAQIPDEEVTWTDPITGEEVKLNKRELYKGKMKVPFTDNTWVNSPFFPFGEAKISIHPILDLFEEYKSGKDNWGRDVTDKAFWRKAVARIPQMEIIARAYELSDQKLNPEKYIQRWISENGSTKWAQGYDPSSTNYKAELDNSKRFWDNARSFFGMPNTYTYDYESSNFKTKMANFQTEYFANTDRWDIVEYDVRNKEQEALAKKYGFTLKQVYQQWAKYDDASTTKVKAQKEEARAISGKFWSEYFAKDKGQQYIKDVQQGVKSERASFLREYLIKSLASGAFGSNQFLIGKGTIKKTLMSLAQDVAYSEVKTARFKSVQMSKQPENKGKFIWRGQVIQLASSQKSQMVRRALSTGDWSAYRKIYGTKQSKIVAEAVRTGDWTAYRKLYGKTATAPKATSEAKTFWTTYSNENDPGVRRKMLADNPQYNKRKDWTAPQWDAWKATKKDKEKAGLNKISSGFVAMNRATASARSDTAWHIRYKPVKTAKWK